MPLDWNTGLLAEGLESYRKACFFEAHEFWESVWLTLDEPEKSFLQAVIQITAAMHHLRKGNSIGAASLLSRSLTRLSRCPSVFGGIETERLREELASCIGAIEDGSQIQNIIAPNIHTIDARLE